MKAGELKRVKERQIWLYSLPVLAAAAVILGAKYGAEIVALESKVGFSAGSSFLVRLRPSKPDS